MKYVTFQRFGGPEVLNIVETTDVPSPGGGMVLVEVKAAGVNCADIATTGNVVLIP